MSNYSRKAKRQKMENNAPRCCNRHMFKNKYGLWQCRKCGRQKFDIGTQTTGTTSPVVPESEVAYINENITNTPAEPTIIDVDAEVVE